MSTEHDWAKLYHAAVLETDWSRISARIEAAELGLKARLLEFSLNHGATSEENQAITDAKIKLHILREEVAAWQKNRRADSLNILAEASVFDIVASKSSP